MASLSIRICLQQTLGGGIWSNLYCWPGVSTYHTNYGLDYNYTQPIYAGCTAGEIRAKIWYIDYFTASSSVSGESETPDEPCVS